MLEPHVASETSSGHRGCVDEAICHRSLMCCINKPLSQDDASACESKPNHQLTSEWSEEVILCTLSQRRKHDVMFGLFMSQENCTVAGATLILLLRGQQ